MLLLPLTLFFAIWGPVSHAGSVQYGQACNLAHQKLQEGTYQFQSDCDAMNFCNSSSLCDHKGCRKDDFPFGYDVEATLPPKCPTGSFCPDEQDACQPVLAVGSACQFNRDDECQGPPDFKELADHTGFGLNVNGSVCLNNICMWSNVTVGLQCVVQNIAYIAYGKAGEFADIVSRSDCTADASKLVCMQTKAINAACDADKELVSSYFYYSGHYLIYPAPRCVTYNCLASGVCGVSADTPNRVRSWVYVVVAICIFGGMFVTLAGMYLVHRKDRNAEREKRLAYWREQARPPSVHTNAFRQNIMQMQETARNSLMSFGTPGGSPRSTMYRDQTTSEDSQMPMLHAANKASALRYYVSEDGMMDDGDDTLVMRARAMERTQHGSKHLKSAM
ncbi:hypothetical protein A0H81_12973 [Grifola frondosa]|uniref:Transmembrane protein n=1 Tax=Grifola frondosa TaxID=5627 RepID=A0A1C7LT62_GRIFR|nr:hypothetical protein A0H81_12973 [Grifola frondosa]